MEQVQDQPLIVGKLVDIRDGIKNLRIGGAATDSKGLFRRVTVGGPHQPLGGLHFPYCCKKTNKVSHFYNDTSIQPVICKEVKKSSRGQHVCIDKNDFLNGLFVVVKGLLIVFDSITSKSTMLFCPASMALIKGIFKFESKAVLNLFIKIKNKLAHNQLYSWAAPAYE